MSVALALELAGSASLAGGAVRVAIASRRRRPSLAEVASGIAELERWHAIEETGRLAGYDPALCIAAADRGELIVASCARAPSSPRSKRELEQQLFFGPGAVWPVENANHVQIIGSVSATAGHAGYGVALASRGLIRSSLAKESWIHDDGHCQLSLDDEMRN